MAWFVLAVHQPHPMRLFIPVLLLFLPSAAFADAFEQYLDLSFPAADGFDNPMRGPGAVSTIGRGRVESVSDGVLTIAHVYYDNHRRRTARSRYVGLSTIAVKVGVIIERSQVIGHVVGGRASVTLADGAPVSALVEGRQELFVPADEPVLLLVEHATHRLARYEKGVRTNLIEVGFGQAKGTKQRQGDLKTPKGMYFVVSKYRGVFRGPTAPYFGGHWIKVNYPNAFDAARGVAKQWISKRAARRIARRWRERKLTNQKTRLGGGIGLHGWAGPWRLEDGGGLSWGCIVLHNPDIKKLFDEIPEGAMVVVF